MTPLRVLAVAVATGRVGYVFFIDGRLCDWGLSRKASKSAEYAAREMQRWIDRLAPDVVVTEKLDRNSRKGEKSRGLIETLVRVAQNNQLLDVSVRRIRRFKDKYTEAKAFVAEFPDLVPWVPKKRCIWEPEPRNTIYFEALALAKEVISGTNGKAARAV